MVERCVSRCEFSGEIMEEWLNHRWMARVKSGVMSQNRQVGREWPHVKCQRCGVRPDFSWGVQREVRREDQETD